MTVFDALAPSYDDDFTDSIIGRDLRGRVQLRLLRHFVAGDHLLELGCGTGEDARFLAARGINVTATDASDAMLAFTRDKCESLPVLAHKLDLNQLDDNIPAKGQFDGAFSNFGALNCLSDWQPLAAWLAGRVRRGGIVGMGVMAPYCAWEFLWHAAHGKWELALRRLRGSTFDRLAITYPTIERIRADFAPYFRQIHVQPLGLWLPPTALFDVVQKRPALLKTLAWLEDHSEGLALLAAFADHYWVELRRT